MNDFYKKFDIVFAEICAKVPQPNSYDLIGTETSIWKLLVNEKGVITIETQYTPPEIEPDYYYCVRRTLLTMFSPEKTGFGTFKKSISHTKLDGYLPVSIIDFETDKGIVREYALVDTKDNLLVKIEFENKSFFFKSSIPQTTDPAEIWKMNDPEAVKLADSSDFDTELATIRRHWNEKLAPVIAWNCPHDFLKNAVLSSFVNAFITQYNGAIRYGATRYYHDAERTAESFPPTIFTMFEACRFFGLQSEGERFFAHFLTNFVSDDGEIHHRGNGASLSEHGMLLECAANASNNFQTAHKDKINAVASRLYKFIEKNELISCCPEDDLRDYPYHQWFSCNLWVVRGLLEYQKIVPASEAQQKQLAAFAAEVNSICRKSAIQTADGLFVPPYPGYDEPFKDMNDFIDFVEGTDIHSVCSYTNYRFYPEMLSSRVLDNDLVKEIIKFRKARGGDFYGATAFRIFRDYQPYRYCIDDWPLYNYLKGLADCGDEDEFIRILAGHMAMHQSRTTFFAPEMSFRDYLDSTHCIPSQMLVPLAICYAQKFN